MTCDEVLAQESELPQREGRVSYRALKIQCGLDDDWHCQVNAKNCTSVQ